MTDVSIRPPYENQFSSALSARIVRKARNDAHQLLNNTRKKAAHYLRAARRRGKEEGLQEGLELARNQLQSTLQLWNQSLQECLTQLSVQIEEGALVFAEKIVGEELRERASAYRPWLEEALATLRREQTLTLHCAPEQYKMIVELTQHCTPPITVYSDESLTAPEIFIQSKLGKIGFGWKEALECASIERQR